MKNSFDFFLIWLVGFRGNVDLNIYLILALLTILANGINGLVIFAKAIKGINPVKKKWIIGLEGDVVQRKRV